MTKRKWAWTGIVVLFLVVAVGGFLSIGGTTQYTMTKQEIQAKIDDKIPFVTKDGVTISTVELDLDDNEIDLNLAASGTKLGQNFEVAGSTRGTLKYDPVAGSFYFIPSDLQLTKFTTDGETVSDKVSGFITKWVDSPKINANKGELAAKAQELATGVVLKGAEVALKRIPVYTLPDDFKGNVARMMVSDIEVKGDTIVATLSFWQLTKMLLFYGFVLILAIGMTAALLMNPGWGIPIIMLGGLGD